MGIRGGAAGAPVVARRGSFSRRAVLIATAGAVTVATTGARPFWRAPTSLFVLGDSWAAGLHADPRHALGQVAAESLGWSVAVDAVSGTGYLNDVGLQASYVQRAQAMPETGIDLVVVQGGSNDGGLDLSQLGDAVRSTVETVRSRAPGAAILLLGPGPDPEPVTARQRHVDDLIAAAAGTCAAPYVSMLREAWIPGTRAGTVIDPVTQHPTTAGQRYLGLRLADALRVRFPSLAAAVR